MNRGTPGPFDGMGLIWLLRDGIICLSFTAPCGGPWGNTPRWIGRVGFGRGGWSAAGRRKSGGAPHGSSAQHSLCFGPERFERDGYLVVRQAFARDDGLAMERQWWRELAEAHGIRRDEPASWRQLPGDLKAAKRDRMQARILTSRVRGVLDDLLGPGAWTPPRDWGRPLVTFPEPGRWELPTGHWHWDNPCDLHLDRPRGAVRGQLHRVGRAARRRDADPFRVAPAADRAGAAADRERAARFDRDATGPVPPVATRG